MIEIKKSKIKLWSKLGSRAVFGMTILELAKERKDFYVMSADLCGSSGLVRFREAYPERFLNMGIAEQNMIGVAGGMAKDGSAVFATSFAPFISMRASEQVRMNMGYMKLNIKTVSLGAGLIMGYLGNSHYGIEDVAVIRAIPNITIISPADCTEIVKAVEAVESLNGPVYLRLTGGVNNPIVYKNDYFFEIGKANILTEGVDVAIIAVGTMVYQSLKAAELLNDQGISATVVNMHTIKPLDTACIDGLLNHSLLVTVEEHTVLGGLGGAVAEYLAPKRKRIPHVLLGIPDVFPHAGDYEYMLEQCGLNGRKIAAAILEALK